MTKYSNPKVEAQPVEKAIKDMQFSIYHFRTLDQFFDNPVLTEYERGYIAGQEYALSRLQFHMDRQGKENNPND